jgi:hypothetical protein
MYLKNTSHDTADVDDVDEWTMNAWRQLKARALCRNKESAHRSSEKKMHWNKPDVNSKLFLLFLLKTKDGIRGLFMQVLDILGAG